MAAPLDAQAAMMIDPMKQMQAMMSIMANGAGTAPLPSQTLPQPASNGLSAPDPAMAQAYAQMLSQYLQTQAFLADPGMAGMAGGGMAFGMGGGLGYAAAPAAPAAPIIQVAVEGMKFQYQLTEDDLQKVFSRYGAVTQIQIDEVGTSAQISFDQLSQAQAAMNDLNGKVLNGLEGTLRISWATTSGVGAPAPAMSAMPPYGMMPPYPGLGFPGVPAAAPVAWPGDASNTPELAGLTGVGTNLGASMTGSGDAYAVGPGAFGDENGATGVDGRGAPHVKGVRKYTCRFLIGIENDKEFQVVRRIIGAKGANMKRIVKQTDAKLRLRGVGSGYFEGAGQKESTEPLQLCVSCTCSEGYRTASRLVEELLQGIFDDYTVFCNEHGLPVPDLRSAPQLVSSGGRGGREGAGAGSNYLNGAAAGLATTSADGAEGDQQGDLEAGDEAKRSRRARRSRGGKKHNGGAEGAASNGVTSSTPPASAPSPDDIQKVIDQRNEARRQCNFFEADRLRQSLHDCGVALMDEPGARGKGNDVTTWRYWRE